MEWILYRGLQRLFAMTTSNEQVQLRVHGLGPMDAYHVTEEELILLERDRSFSNCTSAVGAKKLPQVFAVM